MFLSNINSLSEILADKNLNQEDAELIQGVYMTGTNMPTTIKTIELLHKTSDVSYDKTAGNPKPQLLIFDQPVY